jgi:hypothetical protein
LKYRLIALDVDGTLLNDNHEVTPRVKAAIQAASRKGAEIVLCTGRGPSNTFPVLRALGLQQGTIIGHNGASIVDSSTRKVLHEAVISPDLTRGYIADLRQRGIHFDINTTFETFVERLNETVARMYAALHVKPISRKLHEGLPSGVVKLSAFASREQMDEVEEAWRRKEHELHYIRSGDEFIDVQHPDATKGKSLERLAAMRGIRREEIVAIGNYFNDIAMIAYAGIGIAMANSPQQVKAEADEVTLSNNEDGVAVALERLGLA